MSLSLSLSRSLGVARPLVFNFLAGSTAIFEGGRGLIVPQWIILFHFHIGFAKKKATVSEVGTSKKVLCLPLQYNFLPVIRTNAYSFTSSKNGSSNVLSFDEAISAIPGMVRKKPRAQRTIPRHDNTAAIPPAAVFRDGPTLIILIVFLKI